jgi:medium-chain acyl-[acyl-carrier-protein] hydrolase
VDTLVTDLLPALLPLLDRPTALFGHSMGALVVLELARTIQAGGLPSPVHVFVSGRSAPHLPDSRPALHALPVEQLVEQLKALGGTDERVLDDGDLMGRLLPVLRADFAVNEVYRRRKDPLIHVPMTVYGGIEDPRASAAELAAWQEIGTESFDLRLVPGGHFAVWENSEDISADIARTLSPWSHGAGTHLAARGRTPPRANGGHAC